MSAGLRRKIGLATTITSLMAVLAASTACAPVERGADGAAGPVRPTDFVSPAPGGPVSAVDCPPTIEVPDDRPVPTRTGPLVPAGATAAVVCAYVADGTAHGATLPLAKTMHLAVGPAAIVDYLNGLPDRPPTGVTPASGEVQVRHCTLMGSPTYRIVLGYPDRAPASVTVIPRCGVVEHAGAVRSFTSMASLLRLWAS